MTTAHFKNISGYSILEILFVLLLVGFFFGIFITSYSYSVQLAIDVKIRNEIERNLDEIESSMISQEQLQINSSNFDTNSTILESGVLFEQNKLNFNLNASTSTSFYSKEECLEVLARNSLQNTEYPICYQIYLKKITGTSDLYCYYIYSIAEYSSGKSATLNRNGLLVKTISFQPGEEIMKIQNGNSQIDNNCAKY